jgi:hypothetical protein
MEKTVACLLFILSIARTFASDPLDTWHWRNPLPTGVPLYGVTYGDGKYVAVGYAGTVAVSEDATNWVARQTSFVPENRLFSIAYGNGRFTAVGPQSIVTSTDTTNWLRIEHTASATDIAYGNGAFVAVSPSSPLVASSDGTNWTTRVAKGFRTVAFGNGTFVAAAGESMTSPDGMTWAPGSIFDIGFVEDLAFGNGIFMAIHNNSSGPLPVLKFLTSSNGQSWTEVTRPGFPPYSELIHDGTNFIVSGVALGGIPTMYTSPNGLNWSSATLASPPLWHRSDYRLQAIASGRNGYVALPSGGTLDESGGTLHHSRDLIHWQPNEVRVLPVTRTHVFLKGNGRTVIAGEGPITVSSDGTTFVATATSGTFPAGTFGTNLFVFTAGGGSIVTSSNGMSWTGRATGGSQLNGLTYGGGLFVAVGNAGDIRTSPDATSWSGRFSGSTVDLFGTAFGNGNHVAVGAGGVILSSPDGATWTSRDSGTTNALHCVMFDNGMFLAAGDDGVIRTSTNGLTWKMVIPWTTTSLRYAAATKGTFLLGNHLEYNLGLDFGLTEIASSRDGVYWQPRRAPFDGGLTGIGATERTFILLGQGAAVTESGEVSTIVLSSPRKDSSGFHFLALGEPGTTSRLQRSPDLNSWEDVLTFTNTGERISLTATNTVTPRTYYRVVAP